MSFFHQELHPIFRLVNEVERASRPQQQRRACVPTFKPSFDVKELKDSYELQGELPGVDQKDIDIEWTDASTLAIKGRTEYTRRTPKPAAPASAEQASKADESTAEKKPYQPSVEEEDGTSSTTATDDFVDVAAAEDPETSTPQEAPVAEAPKEQGRFWVSERSVGSFHRTFTFPVRVESENVKASLKNGILSVVVPKAKIPEPRRINIE
jgi:HSP20 family protein